jgi:4-hydroxybenzoate polyprenyltransferase
LGENTKLWSIFFSRHVFVSFSLICSSTIALIGLAGWNAGLGLPFYFGLAGGGFHLAWQIATLDINNPQDCGAKFRSNKLFGLIIFFAILLGKWM